MSITFVTGDDFSDQLTKYRYYMLTASGSVLLPTLGSRISSNISYSRFHGASTLPYSVMFASLQLSSLSLPHRVSSIL